MSKFARRNIKTLKPYVPGEQPPPHADVAKLNTNENPYPPAPAVRRTLRRFPGERLRKYPEPTADTFRRAAARVFRVRPEMIITGNGSDELLNLAIRTFVEPGKAIAYPVPTYSLYPVLAQIQGVSVCRVPFTRDFSLPERLEQVNAALTFICNPNAPTGTFIEPSVISRLARRVSGVVVVDEAYVDFADANCLKLVKRHANVIVMRTLSKGYALAGLRFGFAVAPAPIIKDLLKTKDSFNCDALSIALATAAISDQDYLAKTTVRIRRQRAWLTQRLQRLGFSVLPSQANFVWAVIRTISAKRIYLQLKRRGVLVRYFDQAGLRRGLRITVGRADENKRLIEALTRILSSAGKA